METMYHSKKIICALLVATALCCGCSQRDDMVGDIQETVQSQEAMVTFRLQTNATTLSGTRSAEVSYTHVQGTADEYIYGSMQAVNVASGMWLDELQTYSDAELKPYNIKQCHFNMGVYETYYTYWIRHRRNGGMSNFMGPMSYGVVRNNFYKMVITGITGLGHSVITPDVMADNYPNSYLDM